jgi:hypothetical protein
MQRPRGGARQTETAPAYRQYKLLEAGMSSTNILSQTHAPPFERVANISTTETGSSAKHRATRSPQADWTHLLEDAEHLLRYSGESGISVSPGIVTTLVSATAERELSLEKKIEVLAAFTSLSASLKPVTADSLRACSEKAVPTLRNYTYGAAALGAFLLVISVCSFIAAGLSNLLTADIARANELALALNTDNVDQIAAADKNDKLIADAKTLAMLQQFAALTREIDGVSRQLAPLVLVFNMPQTDQTQNRTSSGEKNSAPGPLELTIPATFQEIKTKTQQLQTVRAFAKNMQERVTFGYGAITNSVLPSLYAMLGALAYLLKTFTEQVRTRTFVTSRTSAARFIIAAIGGGVVGLFSTTLTQGTSLSLLAIAFLIGYATDVFFSFLDGLLLVFKTKTNEAQSSGSVLVPLPQGASTSAVATPEGVRASTTEASH